MIFNSRYNVNADRTRNDDEPLENYLDVSRTNRD